MPAEMLILTISIMSYFQLNNNTVPIRARNGTAQIADARHMGQSPSARFVSVHSRSVSPRDGTPARSSKTCSLAGSSASAKISGVNSFCFVQRSLNVAPPFPRVSWRPCPLSLPSPPCRRHLPGTLGTEGTEGTAGSPSPAPLAQGWFRHVQRQSASPKPLLFQMPALFFHHD